MSQSEQHREQLIKEFADTEYRYAYAEDLLNTTIATQIYTLREQRGMTQTDLAQAVGTKQSGISRLENVNYSAWKIETLKKIARALGVRLRVSFETFGTLLDEDATFSRESLQRPKFENDLVFQPREPTKPKQAPKFPAAPQRLPAVIHAVEADIYVTTTTHLPCYMENTQTASATSTSEPKVAGAKGNRIILKEATSNATRDRSGTVC